MVGAKWAILSFADSRRILQICSSLGHKPKGSYSTKGRVSAFWVPPRRPTLRTFDTFWAPLLRTFYKAHSRTFQELFLEACCRMTFLGALLFPEAQPVRWPGIDWKLGRKWKMGKIGQKNVNCSWPGSGKTWQKNGKWPQIPCFRCVRAFFRPHFWPFFFVFAIKFFGSRPIIHSMRSHLTHKDMLQKCLSDH